jgi:hypothetical protein
MLLLLAVVSRCEGYYHQHSLFGQLFHENTQFLYIVVNHDPYIGIQLL